MAGPKRRTSRSNTRKRRSNWRADRPALVELTIGGRTARVPYALVPAYRSGLMVLPD